MSNRCETCGAITTDMRMHLEHNCLAAREFWIAAPEFGDHDYADAIISRDPNCVNTERDFKFNAIHVREVLPATECDSLLADALAALHLLAVKAKTWPHDSYCAAREMDDPAFCNCDKSLADRVLAKAKGRAE